MSHRRTTIGILMCSTLLLASTSDAARRKMYVGQFPMTTGSRWTYAVRDSVRHHTDTVYVRVLGQGHLDDGRAAMMWRYRTRGTLDTEYVVRSGDTITFCRNSGGQSARAVYVFPLVPGKRWTVIPPGSSEVRKIMTTATPVAVFRHTFTVTQQPAVRNFAGETSFWLEPWVGIVKIHRKSVDTINDQTEETTWQLIGWSIAR